MSNKPVPNLIIAAYIAEIEQPGIPYISTSHVTLYRLGREHGGDNIQAMIDAYFKAVRQYQESLIKENINKE